MAPVGHPGHAPAVVERTQAVGHEFLLKIAIGAPERRAGRKQGQAGQPVLSGDREFLCHHAAYAVPDEMDRRLAEVVQERAQCRPQAFEGHGFVDVFPTISGHVPGDDAVTIGERVELWPPRSPQPADAVQQHDRRALAPAYILGDRVHARAP